MIENIFPVVRYVQVGITVVVVIADRHSHAVVAIASFCQTSLLGNVREAAVFILAIKAVPVTRIVAIEILWRWHRTRNPAAVHQENIEQPVVVVIEQGHAARHGFDQILLRSGGILQGKVQARTAP